MLAEGDRWTLTDESAYVHARMQDLPQAWPLLTTPTHLKRLTLWMPLMAMRSPVSAIDPNGRGGDEGGRQEGRQQAASPLRLSESSVARLVLAAGG